MRNINGYTIETVGGFITIKHWIVCKGEEFIGIYFKFGKAKTACLNEDFSGAYKKSLY